MIRADPVLEVEELTVEFRTDEGVVQAVRGLSWSLEPGQVLGVVGESGSGKSVSGLAVMGLLPATAEVAGSVRFKGRELLALPPSELNAIRGKELAMVFQNPMTSLNPVHSVGWQLTEAVRTHQDVSRRAAWARAVELLELVGIPDARQRARSYPHELSGGMRQRVMIALAMANDPAVIIADEPTTALDVTVQAQVLATLKRARDRTQSAMVLITHDLGVVAGTVDHVLVMYAGRAVEVGPVDEVFYRPRMPYTMGLLASLPRLGGDGTGPLTPIVGAPPSLVELPAGCPFSPRCPMAQETCKQKEPVLRPVDHPDHHAACHYAEDLVSAGDARAVFAAGGGRGNGDQVGVEAPR